MNDLDEVVQGTFIELDVAWSWEEWRTQDIGGRNGGLKRAPHLGMLDSVNQNKVIGTQWTACPCSVTLNKLINLSVSLGP